MISFFEGVELEHYIRQGDCRNIYNDEDVSSRLPAVTGTRQRESGLKEARTTRKNLCLLLPKDYPLDYFI